MKKINHNLRPMSESFHTYHKNHIVEDLKFFGSNSHSQDIFQKDEQLLREAYHHKKPIDFRQIFSQFQKPLNISSLHQELDKLVQDICSSNKLSYAQMESLLQIFLSHLYYLETTVDKTVASLLEIYGLLSVYLHNLKTFEAHKEEPKSFLYLSMEQTSYPPSKKDKKEKTVQYYFNKYVKPLLYNPQGMNIPIQENDPESRRKLRSVFNVLRRSGELKYKKHKLDRFEGVILTEKGVKEFKKLFGMGGDNQ